MADEPNIQRRLSELEADHQKAVRYRDKWAAKAKAIEAKLDAFKLVSADLGIEASVGSSSGRGSGSSEGLTAAVKAAIMENFAAGSEVSPSDIRRYLGEYDNALTTSITKAMVRMTEGDEPALVLSEKGRGKRQSRYVVLVGREDEDGEQGEADVDSAQNVREFRQSG